MIRLAAVLALSVSASSAQAQSCGAAPVQVQVLGGGPELTDPRATAAILVWIAGKARLLVDAGPGAARRFVQAGANLSDLDAILFTHLQLGRTADLPALVQLSSSPARARPLPIFGPTGNRAMPSTVSFVRALFDPARGAWRHLGEFLSPLARTSYKLQPHDLRLRAPKLGVPREDRDEILSVFSTKELRVTALPLTNGDTPALAWRVDAADKGLVIIHDASNDDALERLAHAANLLVVPPGTIEEVEANKRKPGWSPTAMGRLAHAAEVKQLVLAPQMPTSLEREEEAAALIRRHYAGGLVFADDFECLTP